jgi:hypothetical protein
MRPVGNWGMAKAYRSNMANRPDYRAAIGQLRGYVGPEQVRCEQQGCTVSYELYLREIDDADNCRNMLRDELAKSHPEHAIELIAIEELTVLP